MNYRGSTLEDSIRSHLIRVREQSDPMREAAGCRFAAVALRSREPPTRFALPIFLPRGICPARST